MKLSSETLYCIRYLLEHGVDASNFESASKLLDTYDVPKYKLVREEGYTFFTSLAMKLRELWPAGEKDGKYPWRSSIKELTERLQMLWKHRELGNKYTIDDCLTVARRYLSQFENDTKFMMTLKYFILKQKKDVSPKDGKISYYQTSKLADMLEGKSDEDAIENEWESLINDVNIGEGRLVYDN